MSYTRVEVTGFLEAIPGDRDHFHWQIENKSATGAWNEFASRFFAHLKNRVPFVVEDHELVASMKVEVRVCD